MEIDFDALFMWNQKQLQTLKCGQQSIVAVVVAVIVIPYVMILFGLPA